MIQNHAIAHYLHHQIELNEVVVFQQGTKALLVQMICHVISEVNRERNYAAILIGCFLNEVVEAYFSTRGLAVVVAEFC